MVQYRVRQSFQGRHPDAVTLIGGVGVALGEKDVVETTAGTLDEPPKTRTFRAATQDDLRHLYETEGHPAIEIVPDHQAKDGKAKTK